MPRLETATSASADGTVHTAHIGACCCCCHPCCCVQGTLEAARCNSAALLTLCLALLVYLQVPVQQRLGEDVQVGGLGLAIVHVCGKVADEAACCEADHHQGDARDCRQQQPRVLKDELRAQGRAGARGTA